MNRSTLKTCPYCGGKGKIGSVSYLPISKMKKLMKKHNLSQVRVAEICGITQTAVSNWFSTFKNTKGIKNTYFEMLNKKGYS